MERMLQGLAVIITGAVMWGCFAPLPIEETPEPKDEPVIIRQSEVTPSFGEVVPLSLDGAGTDEVFTPGPIEDPNLEQALYLSVVIDVNNSLTVFVFNREISPLDRETQSFLFRPCASRTLVGTFSQILMTEERVTAFLYMAISDDPVATLPAPNSGLDQAFTTTNERPVQIVSWTLELTPLEPGAPICTL